MPFEDNSFDRAFSMPVLQFIPDAARAVAEIFRVVRPGGKVTAAISDVYGGTPHTRLIWDIAGVLNPCIERPLIRPLSALNELATLWAEFGLLDVEQTSLLIRADFSCFEASLHQGGRTAWGVRRRSGRSYPERRRLLLQHPCLAQPGEIRGFIQRAGLRHPLPCA